MVFGIVGRVDVVGWVGVGALVEVVLARGGSYGRLVKFGRAVVFRCIASAGGGERRVERWGLEWWSLGWSGGSSWSVR